jgi:hypothetical protein
MDLFVGRNAARDVFPTLIAQLESVRPAAR